MSISFETLALAKRYTRSAVAEAMGGVSKIDFRFVTSLPLAGETGVIYCVSKNGSEPDLYDEYYYVNGRFERIPGATIDLTPYATKDWVTGEGYYKKPADGIPGSDLDAALRASIAKAETALQQHQSLAAYRTAQEQDEIDNTLANIKEVEVSDIEPTDPNVKLWIYQNPGQKIEIPTMEDFRNLKPATDEQVAEAVSDWLEENISGGETIAVDKSLTVEGAAADAKVVGALKSAINDPVTGLGTKAPVIINTASGAIASFDDGADGMLLKSLTVNVEPVQAAGTPSPENPLPISGWTGVNVSRTGINVWDEEWRNGYYSSSTGKFVSDSSYVCCKNGIRVVPNAKYYVNIMRSHLLLWYDDNDAFIGPDTPHSAPHEYTAPANARYMRFYAGYSNTYKHDITINYPSTDHDYHPGTDNVTIPIAFKDANDQTLTVYGGVLDVKNGVLTVDKAIVDLGTLTWTYHNDGIFRTPTINGMSYSYLPNWLCSVYTIGSSTNYDGWKLRNNKIGFLEGASFIICVNTAYTDAASFTAAMAGQTLVYELTTPIEITLTPTQIKTLLGTNNIWADCGDVSVDYPADTKLFIHKVNKPTDDDMTADAQIASGKYFIIGNNLYLSTTTIPAGDTIIPGTNCTKTDLAAALNALNT